MADLGPEFMEAPGRRGDPQDIASERDRENAGQEDQTFPVGHRNQARRCRDRGRQAHQHREQRSQAVATSSRSLPTRMTLPSGITQRPVSLNKKHEQVVASDWSGWEMPSPGRGRHVGFGRPNQQPCTRNQAIVKLANQPPHQFRPEIDHHIAANNQVESSQITYQEGNGVSTRLWY